MLRGVYAALGASLAILRPISQRSVTMLRCVAIALAVSSVAALQPPASRQAKANPAAIDVYSRATAASAARDVALYGLFGPSEAEKRAEQARLDAEQEALNERFRKESESDFAFMSVFGVVTRVGRVRRKWCLRHAMTTSVRGAQNTPSPRRKRRTQVAADRLPHLPRVPGGPRGGRRRRDLLSGAPRSKQRLH